MGARSVGEGSGRNKVSWARQGGELRLVPLAFLSFIENSPSEVKRSA